jgi:hypothetical protein
MFAIDGCKLPSNASKDWSGTHADLTKKQLKIDRAVRRMLKRHRVNLIGSCQLSLLGVQYCDSFQSDILLCCAPHHYTGNRH